MHRLRVVDYGRSRRWVPPHEEGQPQAAQPDPVDSVATQDGLLSLVGFLVSRL